MSAFNLDDFEFSVIDLAILRLETVSNRAAQFMDNNMMDFAIREIEDPMKSIATSRRHAQSFIDSMHVIKMGYMKIGFAIDLTAKTPTGIPINKLLEFGWPGPYEIHGNPWLAWTGGKYGPGPHIIAEPAFVTHPGFRGYHMIATLENWGFIERFVSKLIEATTDYLRSTAFS